MKIIKISLIVVVSFIAIVAIWIGTIDNTFAEGETSDYINSSEKLFAEHYLAPESKVVETDGPVKKVHYYEMGSGKPLILIHGGGGYASQWYTIMQDLADTAHLFVVDRPGCGLTDYYDYENADLGDHGAEFIRSFMDATELESATIVGHSMGGLFSVNFANKYEERIDKLILIGHPAGGTKDIPPMMRLMGVKGINKGMRKMIGPPSVKGTKEFHSMMLVADTAHLPPSYWENDVNAQRIPGTAKSFNSLLENCVGFGGFTENQLIHDKLTTLSIPVHFIIGDQDIWDTMENAKTLVASMPQAKLTEVENASHLPWLDNPSICAQLITETLHNN
ncbi:alpha/beta hydrolase [Fulvivirga sp. RKSG066]|uniref:alpha/beta fold hydrolase n=1 Tax=Fulvivirga aurantia TaxID=2529383 RepID=UPI0012BD6C82|nr:alpha/beta hydrolase [Fulvivirga aurantia]MTI23266.1 alpha/beta hydrolase [Fulvivirga aurantia]